MENNLIGLFLINGLLCGLLTAHLLANPIKNEHTRTLGACYGLIALIHGFAYLSLSFGLWPLGYLRAVGATLIGPFFYYYFQSILSDRKNAISPLALHLIPGVIVAAILFGEFSQMMAWVTPILLVSFSGYLAASAYNLKRAIDTLKQSNKAQPMAYQWLKILAAILATNVISECLISGEVSHGTPITDSKFAQLTGYLFLTINLVTVYVALQRHPLWDWMLEHAQVDEPTSNKDIKSTEATAALLKQFLQKLDKQQWFKDESGFTIAMAARKLNIPQRQLSEAINAETGLSYSQLMNKRRVEEATKLMRDYPSEPLTSIMFDAGFRTKSSFNREFLKVTGKTPSEYLQAP